MSTNEHGPGDDEAIIAALLGGASYVEAAKLTGVSRATIARRMQDPAFRSEVEHGRAQVLYRIADQLTELSSTAIGVYSQVLNDDEAATTHRLRAADSVLSHVRSIHAEVVLADRFQALEERVEAAVAAITGDVLDADSHVTEPNIPIGPTPKARKAQQ